MSSCDSALLWVSVSSSLRKKKAGGNGRALVRDFYGSDQEEVGLPFFSLARTWSHDHTPNYHTDWDVQVGWAASQPNPDSQLSMMLEARVLKSMNYV